MQNLLFDRQGRIGIISLNRPAAYNVLNQRLLQQLDQLLSEISDESVNEGVKGLIITGVGEKAFTAGADIQEMAALSVPEATTFARKGQQLFSKLERMPLPIIAAVNGFALGGGLELALACDFIYASETAQLGLPEVSLGLVPGFGGTQRLACAVGMRRAKELIFSGKKLRADEALAIGLINQMCKPGELMNVAITALQCILTNSPSAVGRAKIAIGSGSEKLLKWGLAAEVEAFTACFQDPNGQEGLDAFLEKRRPVFR